MITKFKIFESNESDYLINKLSEECLLFLGFEKSTMGFQILNLVQQFHIYDTLIIDPNNKIFLNEFNNSRFLIDDDRTLTTKIYIDKYLEYYDYQKSNVFKKYSLLSFFNNTFIPKPEHKKILIKKYGGDYSPKYIDELNDKSITKYKANFDKVIDLIRVLEGNESECKKQMSIKKFKI